MERGHNLKIDINKDGDTERQIIPAKDDKGKEFSEAYFVVAKMFEYLHIERGIVAEDLYYFLQHPRDKKGECVAKEIKKYFKQHYDAIGTKEQKSLVNGVFSDMTKWVGSYREFVDFIDETHILKELVDKILNPHEDRTGRKNQKHARKK
ncbi:MAG: hypothetical protein RBG13Loki_1815 [Promethearchaeota archaeon CR_4]|nr:MAG: hypothetical protein RBG13Loki_1815 [Candidatus Lokiarchaeota archaeon CR_4]